MASTRGAVRPITLFIGLFVALLVAFAGSPAQAIDDGEQFALVVLHNNDGESALLTDEGEGGAALFAGLVADRKAFADFVANGSVMVSSGDNFLAGPEFTAGVEAGIFYDALALEEIGYDAISLGNHDFDFGPNTLAEFIGSYTNPPTYLSANVDLSPVPDLAALDIVKSTVVNVGASAEPVGIIGAITPNLPFISSPFPVVVDPDVAGLVQAEIDALTAQGVEIIILISHLQGIEEDVELAAQLTDLDVMVAGGGDELLANETTPLLPSDSAEDVYGSYPIIAQDKNGNEVPVVTTSGSYGYLGELILVFDDAGKITSHEGNPIRVLASDGITPNAALETSITAPVTAALDAFASNVIATSDVALDGTRSSIRSVETNQGNLIADSQLWQAGELAPDFGLKAPQIAMGNGGGIRNDSVIPAGDITELDTFSMVPFSNFLTILEDMSPAQVKDLLENAVSRVDGATGGTGRFAQVAGVSFTYDPSATAMQIDDDGNITTPGERVQSAVLDDGTALVTGGFVVPGAPPVTVSMVDFLARGGDQYPVGDHPFTVIGVSYQQALSAYIQGPLAGQITADQYPAGGEGRVAVAGEGSSVGGVLGNGQWLVPGADAPFFFGDPGDVPFLGDWDGDGIKTPGLYRPSTGFAYVRDSNDFGVADRDWFMGNPGDIPIVGDWDGDGVDTFGVYRPSEGKVYLRNAQSTGFADVEYFFGNPGDTPFSGDFDGDGVDTVGLYRESAGLVYFRNEQSTGVAESEFFFGAPGDIFIGGDWDGDGIDTVGVIRPSTNTFFGRNSNTQGIADFEYGVSGTQAPIVSDSGVLSFAQGLRSLGSNTLLAAIGILEEEGLVPPPDLPTTLFAPTDAAFEALPPDLLADVLADPFFLSDVVGGHAVEGLWVTEELLAEGFLQSLSGPILVFSDDGGLLVNGVPAEGPIVAGNAHLYSIPEVLLGGPEPVAFLTADHMRGTTEVSAPGDPAAFGIAFFNYTPLDETTGLMCAFSFLTGEQPTALHIHEGAAGVEGPVVWDSGTTADDWFPGDPFDEWTTETCAEIDAAVADAIIANPGGYYANAHSATYPGGKAREQLIEDPGFDPFPIAYPRRSDDRLTARPETAILTRWAGSTSMCPPPTPANGATTWLCSTPPM